MAVVKAIPYEGVTYRSAAICRVMTGSKRRKHGRESHPRRPRSSAGPLTSSPGRRPAAGHALPPCDEDREALKKMIIPNRPISRIEIIFFSRESSSTKKKKSRKRKEKMAARRRSPRNDTRTLEAATYLRPPSYLREITHLGGSPRRVGLKLHGDHHTCTHRQWDL